MLDCRLRVPAVAGARHDSRLKGFSWLTLSYNCAVLCLMCLVSGRLFFPNRDRISLFRYAASILKLLVVPMLNTPSVSVCTALRISGRMSHSAAGVSYSRRCWIICSAVIYIWGLTLVDLFCLTRGLRAREVATTYLALRSSSCFRWCKFSKLMPV